MAQWLGLCTFSEGGTGSVHGQELSSHKPLVQQQEEGASFNSLTNSLVFTSMSLNGMCMLPLVDFWLLAFIAAFSYSPHQFFRSSP